MIAVLVSTFFYKDTWDVSLLNAADNSLDLVFSLKGKSIVKNFSSPEGESSLWVGGLSDGARCVRFAAVSQSGFELESIYLCTVAGEVVSVVENVRTSRHYKSVDSCLRDLRRGVYVEQDYANMKNSGFKDANALVKRTWRYDLAKGLVGRSEWAVVRH